MDLHYNRYSHFWWPEAAENKAFAAENSLFSAVDTWPPKINNYFQRPTSHPPKISVNFRWPNAAAENNAHRKLTISEKN
jgi:hypothetical protein